METRAELMDARTSATLGSFEWRHDYEFKQADMGRTWVEVGWLEWGIIPLIGGFFATQYDTDQTREFLSRVTPSYGSQVAARIARQLPRSGTGLPRIAPADSREIPELELGTPRPSAQ